MRVLPLGIETPNGQFSGERSGGQAVTAGEQLQGSASDGVASVSCAACLRNPHLVRMTDELDQDAGLFDRPILTKSPESRQSFLRQQDALPTALFHGALHASDGHESFGAEPEAGWYADNGDGVATVQNLAARQRTGFEPRVQGEVGYQRVGANDGYVGDQSEVVDENGSELSTNIAMTQCPGFYIGVLSAH